MTTDKRRDFSPRAKPSQERARRTVDKILAATGELLEEVGLDGCSTNAVAARAGVRVRSVYRYFPNKEGLIVALAQQMTVQWGTWFGGFAWVADPDIDPEPAIRGALWRFHDGVRALPGAAAVRRAMRASAVLRALDQEDNARLAEVLARALSSRAEGVDPRRAHVTARTIIETAVAVMDVAILEEPEKAPLYIEELVTMFTLHVAELSRQTMAR